MTRWLTRDVSRIAVRGISQVVIGRDQHPASTSWQRRLDRVLAGVAVGLVIFAALIALLSVRGGPHLRLLVLAVAVVLPLLLAVHYPLTGWRIAWLAAVFVPLLPHEANLDPVQLSVLLILFGLTSMRYPRAVLWSMCALTLVPIWLWTGFNWRGPLLATVTLILLAIALDAVTSWQRARTALATQTQLTEQELARRAVLEERSRIARELHDVVAHHLSLIAVQAETAPYRLPELAEPIRQEFAALSTAARATLVDMRELLGVLRNDDVAERTPQPQLSELPALVAAARRAGLPVEFHAPGLDGPVRPSVAVSAYRIVQEALSNAGRHAPSASVTVLVERDQQDLRLSVTNTPCVGPASLDDSRTGHGLAGMHERVTLLGGSITARPTDDGGFAVVARLPLEPQ